MGEQGLGCADHSSTKFFILGPVHIACITSKGKKSAQGSTLDLDFYLG